MRIQIVADLHLEFDLYPVEIVDDADVLVIAGDFASAKLLGKLEDFVKSVEKPVLFVAGNHEYYDGTFEKVNGKLEKLESQHSVFSFLNNRSVDIGGVKFIGSTLWSDFDLASDPVKFASIVEFGINDFSLIRKLPNRKFSANDCRNLNEESRLFLKNEIKASSTAKRVVITHFLPHPRSIHPLYEGNPLNPYFCCNCQDLMGNGVSLWIHGHTHVSIDYVYRGTRVIANPRGYYGENKSFNGELVAEV